jgi:hypothetical protein
MLLFLPTGAAQSIHILSKRQRCTVKRSPSSQCNGDRQVIRRWAKVMACDVDSFQLSTAVPINGNQQSRCRPWIIDHYCLLLNPMKMSTLTHCVRGNRSGNKNTRAECRGWDCHLVSILAPNESIF